MTVDQFKEITDLKQEDHLGPISYGIELISIYADKDPDEVRKERAKFIREQTNLIENELRSMTVQAESVVLDDVDLQLMPFANLRLGEYIDLESYATNNEISKVLSVLYRRWTDGGIDKDAWEPYKNVDVEKRSKIFGAMEARELVPAVANFVKFRHGVVDSYDSLFAPSDDLPGNEEDDMTPEEIRLRQAEKVHAQFSWESFILFLAEGDVTKWEAICDLPIYLAFNIASYKKSLLPKQ